MCMVGPPWKLRGQFLDHCVHVKARGTFKMDSSKKANSRTLYVVKIMLSFQVCDSVGGGVTC